MNLHSVNVYGESDFAQTDSVTVCGCIVVANEVLIMGGLPISRYVVQYLECHTQLLCGPLWIERRRTTGTQTHKHANQEQWSNMLANLCWLSIYVCC